MSIRGIRNNNPGNIRHGSPWQGLAPMQNDKEFCTFIKPEWGIRAIARLLITYQDKRLAADGSKIDTIQEIIERWAPASENNVSAYVSHVRRIMALDQGVIVSVHDFDTMKSLVKAIITHECGSQPYTEKVILKGLVLAGVAVPEKPLSKSTTIKAGQVAAGATVLTAIAPVIEQLEPVFPIASTLAAVAPWVLAVIALAGIGWMIWRRMDDQSLRIDG